MKDNELLLRSIDNKDCVFSTYEGKVAKCAIEKAYNSGKIDFKKPISCHLFPIRVSNFGGDVLRFEKLQECEPAMENGKELDVTVAEFCREPLERLYGKNWFNQLKELTGK